MCTWRELPGGDCASDCCDALDWDTAELVQRIEATCCPYCGEDIAFLTLEQQENNAWGDYVNAQVDRWKESR